MYTKSQQRRINLMHGRPMNEGIEPMDSACDSDIDVEAIKAETVREFANRLKNKIGFTDTLLEVYEYIDDIVKEMGGDG